MVVPHKVGTLFRIYCVQFDDECTCFGMDLAIVYRCIDGEWFHAHPRPAEPNSWLAVRRTIPHFYTLLSVILYSGRRLLLHVRLKNGLWQTIWKAWVAKTVSDSKWPGDMLRQGLQGTRIHSLLFWRLFKFWELLPPVIKIWMLQFFKPHGRKTSHRLTIYRIFLCWNKRTIGQSSQRKYNQN